MAVVTLYQPFDPNVLDTVQSVRISASPTSLVAGVGGHRIIYYGNFTYDGFGNLTGGAITEIGFYFGETALLNISQFSISVATLLSDPGGLDNEPVLVTGSASNDTFDADGGNDIARMGTGDDTMRGGLGNDQLFGEEGNDSLFGEGGDDFLDGGSGVDVLDGGLGNDTYVVVDYADVIVDAGGADTIRSSVSWTLAPGLEHLTLLGSASTAIGNHAGNAIVGNAAPNTLFGGEGDDFLDGGPGADFLGGGGGNDTFIVDDPLDVLEEFASGLDHVRSFVDWTLATTFSNLTLLGSAIRGVGSSGFNTIVGNEGANFLTGGGASDVILGEAGDDWIEGDRGNNPLVFGETPGHDTLAGGTGHDTILAGAWNDLVRGESGNDTIIGESGNDVLYGDEGYDAIDGGDGGDVLVGGSEADILFGAADSDTLNGGEGDDIMMGERNVDDALGALDVLYGEGGNDLMHGGGGDDWIFAGNGVDVIDGNYGSDLILGGPGGDIMLGSGASEFSAARAGNDLFVYTGMVDAGDHIWGFDTRPGDTDGIDLRALFDNIGYSALTPRLNGFMSVTQGATATDAVVSIDTNGGGDSYSVLVTLHGVSPATLTDSFFLFQ